MNKLIYGLSRAMAWFGSFVLVIIAVLSVASSVGRALSGLGLGPVPGDFELVAPASARSAARRWPRRRRWARWHCPS